jgi:hypothetical protein
MRVPSKSHHLYWYWVTPPIAVAVTDRGVPTVIGDVLSAAMATRRSGLAGV